MPASSPSQPHGGWLILVKHALPLVEPAIPAAEWRLSPLGRERCASLADWLRSYLPFAIFTSQEPKASETGQLTARLLNIPCQARPGLHEHVRPQAGLLSHSEFQASVRSLFEQPAQVVYGSESANQACARFSKTVDLLLQESAARPGGLVIVAHGTVISLFSAMRASLPPYPLWQSLGLPSAVVFERLPDGQLGQQAPLIKPNITDP